ncbi:MAG: ATP-binding protein [bacterium]|jgi:two-component system phosphate regulon sensor histidine kinase PhoR
MTNDGDNVASLREQLESLKTELGRRSEHIVRLESANRKLSEQVQNTTGQSSVDISEIETTLRRVLSRAAMILQATQCAFMFHDEKTNELFADTPAIGIDDETVKRMRVSATQGISGEVYRTEKPVILYDAETDVRAQEERLAEFGIQSGVCVPLAIERRDEETNRILEKRTIGVLWVFNKRFGNIFIEEDIQLLERMAKGAAAVINSAEKVREITRERDEAVETIEALSMGLIMVNANQRVTQMNNSALQIFGLTKETLALNNALIAVVKDEKVRTLLTQPLSGVDGDITAEVSLPDPESPEQMHTFQVQSATVRNDAGDIIGTATIFNDITELKNVDKMKTAFVSTVSHELRTPLTAIKGFVATLLQDTDGFYDNDTRTEFYQIIDTECDRLRRLIDDLLNVSRIESGKSLAMNIGDVNMSNLVDKVIRIQSASQYKKPNHTLVMSIDPSVPIIQADEDKVEQIFNNLISNALKYAPRGGEIKVSGKMMSDELVQLSVSDQGMGIPKEQLPKMFQRFHRVDNRDTREIGGTGIGLFLVKAFVEQHNGQIWVESEHGKGTTFHFTLPTTQPEQDDDDGSLAMRVSS